jgi:hypothetical protein
MVALGCFALWNAFRQRRRIRAVEVAATFGDGADEVQDNSPRALTGLERLLSLGALAALGAIGVAHSWLLYIAGLGALAYTTVNLYLLSKRRRSSAITVPFLAIPFLGGCGIVILLGAFVGAIFFH